MENYVRYFVKFFMIVLITGLAFLFVVVIRNNTSSKLDKDTNLTNVIDNDEADNNSSSEEEEKNTSTKQTDSKTESINSNVKSSSSTTSKANTTTSSITDNKSNTEKDTSTVSKDANDSSTNNVSNTTTINKTEQVQENISSSVDKNVEFSLSFDTKTLTVGETSKITVNSNEKNLTINYKSFDESVVSVDKNGTIKALKPGNTYLEVNVNDDSSKIVEISVNAKPVTNTVTKSENNASNNSQNSSSNTNTSQVASDTKQSNNQTSTSNDSKTNDSTQTSSNDQSSTSNGNQPSQETKKEKNGWYTINGKKYYYKNGVKVKNSYVDYIYLNKNGVAQSKIGTFSATLYGATAWTNQSVNIRKAASQSSTLLGEIPAGGKVVILSAENASTKYIKIKYNNITGYVYSDFLLINLPDVIPDMLYEITSASSVTSKAANVAIPGVTGKNLYGFTKKYNSKIGKETYYAPLLYPTAKKLQKAYNKAKKEGYNLKVYDAYRPHDITVSLNDKFRNLYNSNSKVKKAIDYDKDGEYWGPSWFLAGSVSAHNKGVALDIAITNSKNQELKAQTAYDTLDTTSLVKYNNAVSNKLRSIMLSQGFSPLESEWWHFQDNNYYNNSPVATFHLK